MYGFDAERFENALLDASVTSLIDIRRRRGVRGASFRFANATALESLLTAAGIRYIAEPRLAPTEEMRLAQRSVDERLRVAKRDRKNLSPEFVASYRQHVLEQFPVSELSMLLKDAGERPCLLCVERDAAACHRNLAAEWISQHTGASRVDLTP